MKGKQHLEATLNKIAKMDLTDGITQACLLVENQAKMKCPVDDGTLRRSITHSVDKNSGKVYTNIEYAPYVEYGTGLFATKGNGRRDKWSYQDDEGKWHTTIGQKPQPFMHPALSENRTKIKQKIAEAIEDMIK